MAYGFIGRFRQDELHDAATWRETIDQTNLPANYSDDQEPDLGFAGIATGWRRGDREEEGDGFVEGDDLEDKEPDNDREVEMWPELCGQGHDQWLKDHVREVAPC